MEYPCEMQIMMDRLAEERRQKNIDDKDFDKIVEKTLLLDALKGMKNTLPRLD